MSGTRPISLPARATKPGLLLVGHGARHGGDPLDRHAAALEATGLFATVATARLSVGPSPRDVLDGINARLVHVVPFFMSDGHCSRVLVPRLLGLSGVMTERRQGGGVQFVRYEPPVGVTPAMGELLRRRLVELCRSHGGTPAATRVVLVAHGSRRGDDELDAERHAAQVAGTFPTVATAFLMRPPKLADVLRQRGSAITVALGLFAAAGRHLCIDVPAALAAAQTTGDSVVWGGSIGEDPEIPGIIVARLGEMVG